jgi:hypothetical protein
MANRSKCDIRKVSAFAVRTVENSQNSNDSHARLKVRMGTATPQPTASCACAFGRLASLSGPLHGRQDPLIQWLVEDAVPSAHV